MLRYLTLIVVFQLAGEAVARLAHLPVPGPVIGMMLLLGFLVWRGSVPEGLDSAAGGLLANLSLLFVPVSAGIVQYYPLLLADWLPLAIAVPVSTLGAMLVTGFWLERRLPPHEQVHEGTKPAAADEVAP